MQNNNLSLPKDPNVKNVNGPYINKKVKTPYEWVVVWYHDGSRESMKLSKYHEWIDHGKRMPYTCEICGKSFISEMGKAGHKGWCKGSHGRVSSCKYCGDNVEIRSSSTIVVCADCKKKDSQKRSRKKLLKQYGLTQEDYDQIIEAQENKCKICKLEHNRLVIDHDHKTGEVRGILCTRCNSCLGWYEEFLEQAKEYLG